MRYRSLGNTGVKVSPLCLGTMTFAHPHVGCDEAAARAIVDRFLETGGNFIDTADVYQHGAAEEIVGRAIEGRRDNLVLATKVAGPMGPGPNDVGLSRRRIISALDASLRRLGTDWIDLYQVHAFDPTTPIEEVLAALDDCVRQGKVLSIGCSNYSAWQLMKANALARAHGWTEFVSLQPEYSLICRAVEREHAPLCLDQGIAMIPFSPLGGGYLARRADAGAPPPGSRHDVQTDAREKADTERNREIARVVTAIADQLGTTPAAMALAWLRAQPGVTAPIVGARSVAQLDDSLACLSIELAPEHLAQLDAASALPVEHPQDRHLEVRKLLDGWQFE